MIVKRKPLNLWERLYLPAVIDGFRVTIRHFFKKKVTMQYPEEKWTVPEGYAARPIWCATRTATPSASPASFANSSVAQGHSHQPPGPHGHAADRPNAEKMPQEFEINMLRCIFCGLCQEVCPEEAIFLQKDYSLTGTSRAEMIYNKENSSISAGCTGRSRSGNTSWKRRRNRKHFR